MSLEEIATASGQLTFMIIGLLILIVIYVFIKKIMNSASKANEVHKTRKKLRNRPKGIEQNPDNPNNIGAPKD